MDKNTFGSSKAAEVLVDLIADDKKISRKVSRCFRDYTCGMRALITINDLYRIQKEELLGLWLDKNEKRVINSNLPEKVKSYLLNVETAYYKVELRKLKGEKDAIHKIRRQNEVC